MVFGEVSVNVEQLCASVWVSREQLDFSLIAAAEHEAGRQTGTGDVGPVNSAVKKKPNTWSEIQGDGWTTRSGLVGNPLEMPRVGCPWGGGWWVVVGRPWLSSRTGWPWPALGACLGQFLAFSSGSSVGICSLAPSSERPSLLNREGLGWWDYKADRGLFLWWLWDCCLHGWYINSPISLLNFVPSPAVCSI